MRGNKADKLQWVLLFAKRQIFNLPGSDSRHYDKHPFVMTAVRPAVADRPRQEPHDSLCGVLDFSMILNGDVLWMLSCDSGHWLLPVWRSFAESESRSWLRAKSFLGERSQQHSVFKPYCLLYCRFSKALRNICLLCLFVYVCLVSQCCEWIKSDYLHHVTHESSLQQLLLCLLNDHMTRIFNFLASRPVTSSLSYSVNYWITFLVATFRRLCTEGTSQICFFFCTIGKKWK